MKHTMTKTIALSGVMGALIFVLMLVETLIFTNLLGITTCFLSLPIAIALSVYEDYKKMFLGGTIFGVCCLIIAFMLGVYIFWNPLVSVLPRVFIGMSAYGVMVLVKKLTKKSNSKSGKFFNHVPYMLAGMAGVLTNTICTLFFIWVFNGGDYFASLISTVIAFNFIPEFVASIILVPAYIKAINVASDKYFSEGVKLSKEELEEISIEVEDSENSKPTIENDSSNEVGGE